MTLLGNVNNFNLENLQVLILIFPTIKDWNQFLLEGWAKRTYRSYRIRFIIQAFLVTLPNLKAWKSVINISKVVLSKIDKNYVNNCFTLFHRLIHMTKYFDLIYIVCLYSIIWNLVKKILKCLVINWSKWYEGKCKSNIQWWLIQK